MVYLKSLIDIVGIVLETLACLSFFDVVYKNKRLNSTKNFYTCIFVYIILHSCISIFVSDSNLKLVFFFLYYFFFIIYIQSKICTTHPLLFSIADNYSNLRNSSRLDVIIDY